MNTLGPEVDMRLEDIGDALEGKKVLDEPYVDKKTILTALKEQNKVIRMLQMAFHKNNERMQVIEETFKVQTTTIDQLKGKVEYIERTVEKVEELESITESFQQKIVTMDDTIGKVAQQGDIVATMSNQLKTQTEQFSTFKQEIVQNVESAKQDLEVLQTTAQELETATQEMGSTIEISSSQIKHETNEGTTTMLDAFVNTQSATLETVESQTEENKSYINETGSVMEKLDNDTVDALKTMTVDFNSLMAWKEEQAGIDLVDIRRSQDNIKEAVDTVQRDLFEKVAREEVDNKLEAKFESIIDHLQSALNSTESDEADFKAVTGNLNQMCESLKNDKADKTEIAALRKQFLQHQSAMMSESAAVDLGGGPESFDGEDIADYLKDFMNSHQIHHELHKKADKHVEEKVVGIGENVDRMKDTLNVLLQKQGMLEQQMLGHANQVENLRRQSSSPGKGGTLTGDDNVPGGEWKGLAGAMRMDATGDVSMNNQTAVESGNFPVSERLQMPREVSKNNNESSNGDRTTSATTMSATFSTPVAAPAQSVSLSTSASAGMSISASAKAGDAPPSGGTPLPAISSGSGGRGGDGPSPAYDAPAYNLTSPLKQPHVMMEAEKGGSHTPLPVIPSQQLEENQQRQQQQMLYSASAESLLAPGGPSQMLATSTQAANPVFQNMAQQPGPLDLMASTAPSGANAVMAGMTLGVTSRPGTREGALGGGGRGDGGGRRIENDEEAPIVHRDKMKDLTPGMTYGGGYQIFSPNKPDKPEIRALEQTTLPELEFEEQKYMIEGDDG
eukprot:CAMPEP_0118652410 /NCGR_PEP_ID=MMETSP0785-20121206/11301_1 /TAXON_ID=91992 /ORGANISM="Bolidomonas pacifica, Strain CCMP 1866" /LENGTH=789 /DNA_ID=CAMNT_0006544921 /DNA_START=126 /DNA_END=2492 /DNA_ORIENTATION=+